MHVKLSGLFTQKALAEAEQSFSENMSFHGFSLFLEEQVKLNDKSQKMNW